MIKSFNSLEYNIKKIEKAIISANGKVDLLCFGETFLQGFDFLSWNYEIDKDIAITKDSAIMKKLKNGKKIVYKLKKMVINYTQQTIHILAMMLVVR